MAAAKKKSSDNRPERKPLSKRELETAAAYAAILRWCADIHEHLRTKLEKASLRLKELSRLHALAKYDEIIKHAQAHMPGFSVNTSLLGTRRGDSRPFAEVLDHAEAEVRAATAELEDFAVELLKCSLGKKNLVTLFGDMHGMKNDAVLELHPAEVRAETPTSPGARLLDGTAVRDARNKLFAMAVRRVRILLEKPEFLSEPEGDSGFDDAMTLLCQARNAGRHADGERTRRTQKVVLPKDVDDALELTGSRYRPLKEDRDRARKKVLELLRGPKFNNAYSGLTQDKRGEKVIKRHGGARNGAIQLVASFCGTSYGVVRDAVQEHGDSWFLMGV